MAFAIYVGFLLGLVSIHVSCSELREQHAGRSQNVFSSYSPLQNQGTHSRSTASSFGRASRLFGHTSSYQAMSLPQIFQPVTSSTSFRENGATEQFRSGMRYNPSFKSRKPNRGRSRTAGQSVVSSGGIIIVHEAGNSKDSLEPKKPSDAKKQLPVYSTSSGQSKSNLYGSPQASGGSVKVWPGSTTSNSFRSELHGSSARRNQKILGSKSVLPSTSELSPAYPFTANAEKGNLFMAGVSGAASPWQGSFGPPQRISSDSQSGAVAYDPVSAYNNQEPPTYPVSNPTAHVPFKNPQTSACIVDLPNTSGLGSIRRCSKHHRYGHTLVQERGSSDGSLPQLAPSAWKGVHQPSWTTNTFMSGSASPQTWSMKSGGNGESGSHSSDSVRPVSDYYRTSQGRNTSTWKVVLSENKVASNDQSQRFLKSKDSTPHHTPAAGFYRGFSNIRGERAKIIEYLEAAKKYQLETHLKSSTP